MTYKANGGIGEDFINSIYEPLMSDTVLSDIETDIVPSTTAFGGTFDFLGWNTSADGTGMPYAPGDTVVLQDNVILYAQWKEQFTDLSITEIAAPDTVVASEPLTYVFIVKNNGSADAPNVVLTDTLPETFTAPMYSLDGGTPSTEWPATNALSLSMIEVGETVTVLLRGTVSGEATTAIANTASVSCDLTDHR
ncbi:MAG: DUF11 domain-containing protein, partial [Clostridiales bacterium]|nr:DUF11 domain-containing protein [Clostridiales bacterium]